MKYIPLSQQLVDVGAELVAPPIAQSHATEVIQSQIGEIGGFNKVEDIASILTTPELLEPSVGIVAQTNHQFTNNNAESTEIPRIETIGATTNSPPIPPIPNLALLILQSNTWLEISGFLQKDSQRLIDAISQFDKAQRKKLASVLIEFLCQEAQNIKEVTWIPIKMLNAVFKRLTFTISRIGGEGSCINEARIECIENLSYVSVEGLGSNKELWVFCEVNSGKNIPVFGTEAICGISVKN